MLMVIFATYAHGHPRTKQYRFGASRQEGGGAAHFESLRYGAPIQQAAKGAYPAGV
jgi:hypothetical protein